MLRHGSWRPFHHGPGTIAHRHIGMPDRGGDGFVITRHAQVNLPGIGGQIGATK